MKAKLKRVLAIALVAAMSMSCIPAASAVETPSATVEESSGVDATSSVSVAGSNLDVANVQAQIQAAVEAMQAQGIKPTTQTTNRSLENAVQKASGLSLEAVKTSLSLELLNSDAGEIDTSQFNLSRGQFNRVMKEVLADYYLTDVAYEYELTNGKVTSISYMPASEAPEEAITAQELEEAEDDGIAVASLLSDEDDEGMIVATLLEEEEEEKSEGEGEPSENPDSSEVTYTAEFNWVRNDQSGSDYTLVYDHDTKEIGYGLESTIDYEVESVTLTGSDGSEITLTSTDNADCFSYITRYSFYNDQIEGSSPEEVFAICEQAGIDTSSLDASMLCTVKYCEVTYTNEEQGISIDYVAQTTGVTGVDETGEYVLGSVYNSEATASEGRINVTTNAEAIHWALMKTFVADYPQYFGATGTFWSSKDTGSDPYGAFKTQIDSYAGDYVPEGTMDYYINMLTLAYMNEALSYGDLLEAKVQDCLAELSEGMTDIQKLLVIHDWLANNANFDMQSIVNMSSGGDGSQPDQLNAFGTLLSDALGYEGAICLGYASAYNLLVQRAFGVVYQDDDGNWVADNDNNMTDFVQIRFYTDTADASVAGSDSGFGGMFNSTHYFNAVKVNDNWYYVDACYDDANVEVMTQYRAETDGNISHQYFMFSPVNALDLFDGYMDYIDSLYDGVIYTREYEFQTDEEGNVVYGDDGYPVVTGYVQDEDGHYSWVQSETEDEVAYDDDQYESTWFTSAVGEIAHDDQYFYYVGGTSYSMASMKSMMGEDSALGQMGDLSDLSDMMGGSFDSADQLYRRAIGLQDEPAEEGKSNLGDSFSSSGNSSMSFDFETYEDPYAESLFDYDNGAVGSEVGNDDVTEGQLYDEVQIDNDYVDMYPDIAHTLGLYNGVIYFNLGNKVYEMNNISGDISDVTVTQLKEYNNVYAKSNGMSFTARSFVFADAEDEDIVFSVFNRPIAAVSVKDVASYSEVDNGYGGTAIVRDDGLTAVMTVSIATNYSQSNTTSVTTVDANGDAVTEEVSYLEEAVNYDSSYNRYTSDEDEAQKNTKFMWCANVVETMDMEGLLAEKNAEDTERTSVTVNAWCGQDGFTDLRTATYGLSDGSAKTLLTSDDPMLNHHYIYNENATTVDEEETWICVHCNAAYHPDDEDEAEAFETSGATQGHDANGVSDLTWGEDEDGNVTCTGKVSCSERYCTETTDEDVSCDVKAGDVTKFATSEEDPGAMNYTASYNGNTVGTTSVAVQLQLGDVNGDGKINAKDVTLLRQSCAEWEVEIGEAASDVNGDGKINVKDITLLRQYNAGWDVELGAASAADSE